MVVPYPPSPLRSPFYPVPGRAGPCRAVQGRGGPSPFQTLLGAAYTGLGWTLVESREGSAGEEWGVRGGGRLSVGP